MPRKLNYTLTTEELQQVENAIKNHKATRVRTRAQMIHMLHLGHDTRAVAKMLMITRATIYFWHKRWREHGVDGLVEKSGRGRPPIGGDEFKQKLEKLIAKKPSEFDYGFSVWTVERLIEHMGNETGHYVSVGTMHKRLKELNFVYRRPKHDLGNLQDKDAKEQAKIAIDALKKRRNQAKSTYSLWTKQQ